VCQAWAGSCSTAQWLLRSPSLAQANGTKPLQLQPRSPLPSWSQAGLLWWTAASSGGNGGGSSPKMPPLKISLPTPLFSGPLQGHKVPFVPAVRACGEHDQVLSPSQWLGDPLGPRLAGLRSAPRGSGALGGPQGERGVRNHDELILSGPGYGVPSPEPQMHFGESPADGSVRTALNSSKAQGTPP
jgi:hypothetical protein